MADTLVLGYGNVDRMDDGLAWHVLAGLVGALGEPVPASGETVIEPGGPAELVARPESLRLAAPGEPGAIAGRVVERRFTGALVYVTVRLDLTGGPEAEVIAGSAGAAGEGEEVAVAPGSAGPRPRIFPAGEGSGR